VPGGHIRWAPDGQSIFFLATDPRTEEETATVASAPIWRRSRDVRPRHVWKVSVADGKDSGSPAAISPSSASGLSPDGRRLALDRAPSPLVDDVEKSEVWVMDVDGKNAVQPHRTPSKSATRRSRPTARIVHRRRQRGEFENATTTIFSSCPTSGSAAEPDAAGLSVRVLRSAWAPDGKTIFVVAGMGVLARSCRSIRRQGRSGAHRR
jgi:dipeptidyl aminopeptidase/acylaminoacyl peptidase